MPNRAIMQEFWPIKAFIYKQSFKEQKKGSKFNGP